MHITFPSMSNSVNFAYSFLDILDVHQHLTCCIVTLTSKLLTKRPGCQPVALSYERGRNYRIRLITPLTLVLPQIWTTYGLFCFLYVATTT